MNARLYILNLLLIITTLLCNGQVQLEPACAESVQQYGVTGFANSRYVWSFDHSFGQVMDGEGTNTITIYWGYKTGTTDMEVLEITDKGCFNFPSQTEIEIMAPDVDLGFDFPEICDEDTLILTVGDNITPPMEILWHDGSQSDTYYADTTEQIWVRVIDGYGCIRYDTIDLLVHPLPEIDLGENRQLCDETDPLYLNPGDFAEYEWHSSLNDEEYYTSYLEVYPASLIPDTIHVTVTDYNDCQTSDYMVIIPCDIEAMFDKMVNTITPNGDGVNDVWVIPYMDLFEEAVLEIFDRWGRLVYRSANVEDEPWDGTSGGRELPMDAYYYVLNLNAFNTSPIVGTVNLIR